MRVKGLTTVQSRQQGYRETARFHAQYGSASASIFQQKTLAVGKHLFIYIRKFKAKCKDTQPNEGTLWDLERLVLDWTVGVAVYHSSHDGRSNVQFLHPKKHDQKIKSKNLYVIVGRI